MKTEKFMPHKVLYSKLFKPPKFLEMPSVSLEIRPDGIAFLLLKNSEKGMLPSIYGFIPLPEGTFFQGEIVKREPILGALIQIKKKTNVCFARLSIPEEKTYIFKTHLPKLEPKEIHDILDFKIEENVPLSVKEAVFDYDIVPKPKKVNGIDVVVSVSQLKIVEAFQILLEEVGLTPIFFSPEASNVAKSIINDLNQQVIVIVNIKRTNIILSLVINSIVCQTSSINFGSTTFTDLLAKFSNVSYEEALKIKNEKLYTAGDQNMEIFSYLINTISAIKDEVYKYVSYCNEREDVTGKVDRIILCGRDAMIVGFDKYLSSNLGLDVDIANVWSNNFDLDVYIPEINRLDSQDMVVINGLSLY